MAKKEAETKKTTTALQTYTCRVRMLTLQEKEDLWRRICHDTGKLLEN